MLTMKKEKLLSENINCNLAMLLLMSILLFSCDKKDPPPDQRNPEPDASFSYTSERVYPVLVQFVNTSVNTEPVAAYFWSFGDGSASAVANPLKAYTQPGTYAVMLVQTTATNVKDSIVKFIQIPAQTPGPSGSSSRVYSTQLSDFVFNVTTSYNVSFANKTTNATDYVWSFGDGSSSTSAAATVTHVYTGTGPFTVKLKATGAGGTDSCSAKISF
jgi:PKD repeat protein